ncbi:MAG: hypothetical protein QF704_11755, partial [Anaerolineales bacterium]|nr:hypothetical protein [Anaerolineales bacterium]
KIDAGSGKLWYTGGKLGIGTTAPSEILHLSGSSGANIYQKIEVGTAHAAGLKLKNSASEFYIYNQSGGNLRFWEDSGADVNITPAEAKSASATLLHQKH